MNLGKIQSALFERLNTLDYAVGDFIDEETPLPYIFISEMDAVPHNTKTSKGKEITQELWAFSNFDGKDELFDIVEQIEEVLKDLKPIDEGVTFESVEFSRIRFVDSDDTGVQSAYIMLTIIAEEEESIRSVFEGLI